MKEEVEERVRFCTVPGEPQKRLSHTVSELGKRWVQVPVPNVPFLWLVGT